MEFEKNVDNLFDIAHMLTRNFKEFLITQRPPGRPGCMLGVDMKLTHKENRRAMRIENEIKKE